MEADCAKAYADSRYGTSANNSSNVALTSDMVFSDGCESHLATVSGSVKNGLTASLRVRV